MSAPDSGQESRDVRADVKDLKVWRKGVDLCKSVYRATSALPSEERFGITGQMRRAALSIPSNLAEGYGRGTRRDYRQFVRVARGSCCELETQIIVAQELEFLPWGVADALLEQLREILRMVNGLIRALGD